MKVNGKSYRTIWHDGEGSPVSIIDQTVLPHEFRIVQLHSVEDAAAAIAGMQVRGAPLIGATAAYGLALAMKEDPRTQNLQRAYALLHEARPTAINLKWALDKVSGAITALPEGQRAAQAFKGAAAICDDDAAACSRIGDHGLELIKAAQAGKAPGEAVNILTHCNAGWLATVDWGTALAPVYKAHDAGVPVHVWVDETRPRNQGAHLTAWELGQHGVPFTLVVDNAGGHLMQRGLVDLCLVGTDRTTASGDVCNKIGTYLKALAAHDNGAPFYVAAPSSSIDWALDDGLGEIPIEQRDPDEVTWVTGVTRAGEVACVSIIPDGARARNDAFDVTPRKYVSGLVTERGVCKADRAALAALFPELAANPSAA